jgi:hypothetical protein
MRLAAAVLIVAVAGAAQAPDLRTRAESSEYVETSRYDDVLRVVNGLAAASPLARFESFGTSEEGRALPLLVLSEPAVAAPDAARRLGRPIVLVQAAIHAGEVEGKEAALILARRLATGDLRPLLKQLIVLIAPLYNADGNERVDTANRPEQNGPEAGVGTRENAKGLDLNRDFIKLESAEARALVALLNRWDPHVVVDLHTTNGSYHGFHLTYSPALNPNADPRLIALTRERLLPAVQAAMLKTHAFRTYYYGNFASEADLENEIAEPGTPPRADIVWRTFDHRPRFGNNYVGLRNRIAILSEAYSYLDFARRVRATEVFVEETLRAAAANAARILALTAQIDGEAKGQTARAPAPRARTRRTPAVPSVPRGDLGIAFRLAPLPAPVDILVGGVARRVNPRSGLEMLTMTDAATPARMRDYGVFEATRTLPLPRGWLIPRPHVDSGRFAAALDRLRWHGLVVQRVVAAAQIDVERFVISRVDTSDREFQGHREARLSGRYMLAKLSAQEGALFVPGAQPLARLAFYLLEPESDDGLVSWNFIQDGLGPGVTYPIYRVVNQAGLKLGQ